MGTAAGFAATAVATVLLLASAADACGFMVVEETCERCTQLRPPAPQPAPQHHAPAAEIVPTLYAVPYPVQVAAGASCPAPAPTCACGGSKQHGTCTCGGSKHDGTCTCGCKKEATCPCGGSKHDGTCTCGKKDKACHKDGLKDIAEEGLHTLFKVVRGGMKMVEHLADHINKKAVVHKPLHKPCGCGAPCHHPAHPRPCGCGCGCGCGCAGACSCGC